MTAMKFDQDKVMMELVRPEFTEGVAKVLTFGAKKYAANNWMKGLTYTRIIGAMKRHLAEIEKGVFYDPESGLPHIDHVGCCVMFLSCFMKWGRVELNDIVSMYDAMGVNNKLKEACDELRTDVCSGLLYGSTESVPATECSPRQQTDGTTDQLPDGSVRVRYDRSSSDNPELVAGCASGDGRCFGLLNQYDLTQETKEKLDV